MSLTDTFLPMSMCETFHAKFSMRKVLRYLISSCICWVWMVYGGNKLVHKCVGKVNPAYIFQDPAFSHENVLPLFARLSRNKLFSCIAKLSTVDLIPMWACVAIPWGACLDLDLRLWTQAFYGVCNADIIRTYRSLGHAHLLQACSLPYIDRGVFTTPGLAPIWVNGTTMHVHA